MMKKKIFFLKRRPKNRHLIWVEKITNIGEIKSKMKMGTRVLITRVTKYTWAGGEFLILFPPLLVSRISEYQFHTGVDL